jgi:hypothetical protein
MMNEPPRKRIKRQVVIGDSEFKDIYKKLVYLEKLLDMECRPHVGGIIIVDEMSVVSIYAGNGRESRFLSFDKGSFFSELEKALFENGYEILLTKRAET